MKKSSKAIRATLLGWALLCLLIGWHAQSYVPNGQGGILGALTVGIMLFLVVVMPITLIYWVGRWIFGAGYISKALSYSLETKDEQSKALKRPLLSILVIVLFGALMFEFLPFLQGAGLKGNTLTLISFFVIVISWRFIRTYSKNKSKDPDLNRTEDGG